MHIPISFGSTVAAAKKKFATGLLLTLASLLLFHSDADADTASDRDISIHVEKNGETIIVDVNFQVPVSQREAWDVLTDFDHMAEFVSNLQSSKVTSRNGNKLQVAQKGKAAHGMLSFAFESVRDVELIPHHTIHTQLVSGNLKKLNGTTQLAIDDGATRISYHGESVPAVWVPPVIGTKFIQNEVVEQFREMRAEMMKRKSRS